MNSLSEPPLSTLERCPLRLTQDQITQFWENGYLAFSEVLSARDVEASRAALSDLARDLVADPATVYSPPRSDLGRFNQSGASYKRPDQACFIQLESGYDPAGRTPEEIELSVRKYWAFKEEAEVFQTMLSPGSRLQDVVESLLGANPIEFQEMALVKPPFIGSEKPWHQDNAFFSIAPLEATLGVWIALDEAGVENGCMHVIPGAHKEGAFRHHHGTDCEIGATLLPVERMVPVPLPPGGALFFQGMLPHKTPPNRSSERRRALQFHYRSADSRMVEDADYDKLFVTREGAPGSCRSASKHGC